MIQINKNPSKRQLQLFAALGFPGFSIVVALLLIFRLDQPRIAVLLLVAALAISILGFLNTRFMRLVYLAMIYATYPIGFVMSHVLLGVVYFVVITLIGALMRLLGKDPMNRNLDPSVGTYWIDKEPDSDTDRYFRQY
jgi:hypothetical protein